LKQTKAGKKTGIDSRFHSWCKTHFRIDQSAGIELLISSKNGNRIIVVEGCEGCDGKEFTTQIINDLKIMWPGLVIVNGRPRHPQSQGLVERRNSTLCDILGKFMQNCLFDEYKYSARYQTYAI
jgi:hypothetical protein